MKCFKEKDLNCILGKFKLPHYKLYEKALCVAHFNWVVFVMSSNNANIISCKIKICKGK